MAHRRRQLLARQPARSSTPCAPRQLAAAERNHDQLRKHTRMPTSPRKKQQGMMTAERWGTLSIRNVSRTIASTTDISMHDASAQRSCVDRRKRVTER